MVKVGSFSLPPRHWRTSASTRSARSGAWTSSQAVNSSLTSCGRRSEDVARLAGPGRRRGLEHGLDLVVVQAPG